MIAILPSIICLKLTFSDGLGDMLEYSNKVMCIFQKVLNLKRL